MPADRSAILTSMMVVAAGTQLAGPDDRFAALLAATVATGLLLLLAQVAAPIASGFAALAAIAVSLAVGPEALSNLSNLLQGEEGT